MSRLLLFGLSGSSNTTLSETAALVMMTLRTSLWPLVDADVTFVAKVVLAMLLRPLGVDVFLRAFVSLPGNWHGVILDGLRLFASVALDRRVHQRSIDDLAAARQVAMCQQLLLHLVEQLCAQARLGQTVAKQPDRFGVGNRTVFGKTEKLHEAATVQQLIFERVVSQIIELSQDQNLGHQDCWIRWPPLARDGRGKAASISSAIGEKSTCLLKPTSGLPSFERRLPRSS